MPESLKRVQKLAEKSLIFYQLDLLDKDALKAVFEKVLDNKFTILNFSNILYYYVPCDLNNYFSIVWTNKIYENS